MNRQNKVNEKENLSFPTAPIVAFIATFRKKEYKTIIQDVLPEVLRQNKLSQAEMDNVLKKWENVELDSDDELNFKTISELLKNGIELSQRLWWIALGIGIALTAIGFIFYNISKNLPNSEDKSSDTPPPPLPICETLNNYVPVAEFVELRDNYSPNFNGGKLTVKLTENGTPNDCLAIRNHGQKSGEIGIDGSNVTYEGNIIGSFQGGEGAETFVVNFNQKATREGVQAVARRVAYSLDTSENPSYGDRIIEFKVTDGDGGDSVKKGLLTQTIRVVNKNNPIAINAPNSQTVKENTNLPIGISINASDSQKVIVTLGGKNGTLSVKENVANGISTNDIANNQTSKVTISGTVAEVNTTLADTDAVIYKGNEKFSGADSLTIAVNEDRSGAKNSVRWPPVAQNSQSVSKSIDIKVEAANPAPVISVRSSRLTTNENEELGIGGIKVSDLNNQNVTLNLEVNNGKLILKTDVAEGLPSDNITDNQTNRVTLKGSIERINNTLAGMNNLIYQSNQNYSGRDFLTVAANDGEKTTTRRVRITVNDHPTLNNPEFVTTSSGRKITRPKAVDRIRKWVKIKQRVFARPYSRSILQQYTTGNYSADRNGTVDWLRKYGGEYRYDSIQVEPQGQFFVEGDRVMVDVKVSENRTLRVQGQIDWTQTGFTTSVYRWTLQFEDGLWKIADSQELN